MLSFHGSFKMLGHFFLGNHTLGEKITKEILGKNIDIN